MSGKEFILPINHSETLNIDLPLLKSKFTKTLVAKGKKNKSFEIN